MSLQVLKRELQKMKSELKQVKTTQKKIEQLSCNKNNKDKCNKPTNKEKPTPTAEMPAQLEAEFGQQNIEIDELNTEIIRLGQHIEELHIKFDLISTTLAKLELTIDDLEQYSRRNCLILHGVNSHSYPNPHLFYDDFLNSVLGKINQQLNLNLDSTYIDIAHPLQRSKKGNTSIIIKFLRRSDRHSVFQKKRLFANTGLSITESLTKRRLDLLVEARSLLGQENVWTYNGSIFTNINSKREKINSQEDMYHIVSTFDI